ncbi:MAG: arginyltransferase [Deltaproteobacteria bacterium]|nr:MAG: arginyltransferase [Deltaproteobacteria bacterium]
MRREKLVHTGFQSCPYLPGRVARLPLYRQMEALTPAQTDESFAAAERRVGHNLYRVACPTCIACEGLRICVQDFAPTRSQARVARRWRRLGERLQVDIGPPRCDQERLDLYHRHKVERGLGDPDDPLEAPGYEAWLVRSCVKTLEMAYRIDGRLVAVGIVDVGETASSSVYFYFDPAPEVARLSPGVYSVLREVELGRAHQRRYHYLGLYVAECKELRYKGNYYPHERRVHGVWRPVLGPDQGIASTSSETGRKSGMSTSPKST